MTPQVKLALFFLVSGVSAGIAWIASGFSTKAEGAAQIGLTSVAGVPLWLIMVACLFAASWLGHPHLIRFWHDLTLVVKHLHQFRLFRQVALKIDFESIDRRTEGYLASAERHLADASGERLPRRAMEGAIHCAAINLLQLSRCVLGAHAFLKLVPNILVFDESTKSLIVSLSADLQSFESVRPWHIDEARYPDPMSHPGICVRAFRTGRLQVKTTMENEELRKDESIKGMISIPLVNHAAARGGELAVININAFEPGIVPDTLSEETKRRVERIRDLGTRLNSIIGRAAQAPHGRQTF